MTHGPVTEEGLPLVAGQDLPPFVRTYTRERWTWAETAISIGADDEDHTFRSERNIHSDESVAVAQGLPGRIAPGALLLNWISAVLVRHFGMGYIGRGALRVKFVEPVLEGEVVAIRIRVRSVEREADGFRCDLDIVLESSSGATCVVGDAVARTVGPQ